MLAFDVLVVDGLVDIEEEDVCVVACEDVGLGEIDDASAVDEEEELDLVVYARLLDPVEEFSVPGHWVHLVLDVLALEQLLTNTTTTDSILREQRESTSMAVKTTIETYEMFISSWIYSNSRMMSFRSILIWRY
jgi:hypothetical protein